MATWRGVELTEDGPCCRFDASLPFDARFPHPMGVGRVTRTALHGPWTAQTAKRGTLRSQASCTTSPSESMGYLVNHLARLLAAQSEINPF